MLVLFSELLLASLLRNIVNCSGVLHGCTQRHRRAIRESLPGMDLPPKVMFDRGQFGVEFFLFKIYIFLAFRLKNNKKSQRANATTTQVCFK